MSIHRIGIVVHEGKQAARDAAETVRGWAARHDIPAVVVGSYTKFLTDPNDQAHGSSVEVSGEAWEAQAPDKEALWK